MPVFDLAAISSIRQLSSQNLTLKTLRPIEGRALVRVEVGDWQARFGRQLLQVRQDAGSGVKEVWFYGIGGIDLDMFYVVRADGFEDIKRLTTCNFRDVFTNRFQVWPEEDEPIKVCGLLL